MAIQSYGYPELLASGADFARMAYGFGRQYVAPFESHCRPTISQTGTRRISISTGYLAGKHIVDFNDTIVTIDLPQASGASQWFLVGLRRWVDTGVPAAPFRSEFGYIEGSALKAIPTYPQVPGTDDFQPIALVRIVSTETIPAELVDLRGIAEEPGVYTIYDDMAMEIIARPGATAYNAATGATYRHVYIANKSRSWQRVWDAPAGPRPTIYTVNRTPSFRMGAREDRVGWGGSVSENLMHKTSDADTHFTYIPGSYGTAGNRFVTKTPGVYSLWANMTISQSGDVSTQFLWGSAVSAPLGGLPGSVPLADAAVVGSTAADYPPGDAVRKYVLETVRYLDAGATISISARHDESVIIETWQMWAQRISD